MSKVKIELVEECPDCGCKVLDKGLDGFISCHACGLVVEADIIDYGPEWRNFEDGSGKSQERSGPAKDIFQHDYGITTEMAPGRSDGAGGQVRNTSKWGKLRRIHP